MPGAQIGSAHPLSVENVLWANTVLAAGSAVGLVVYTGKETRAVLNTSEPETKMGTLENEVNRMAKVSRLVSAQLIQRSCAQSLSPCLCFSLLSMASGDSGTSTSFDFSSSSLRSSQSGK